MNPRYQSRADLQRSTVSDDLVLYDPVDKRVITLNAPARAIWELCDGSRDLGAIVECLSDRFEGPRSLIEADVAETLTELEQQRVLTRSPEPQ